MLYLLNITQLSDWKWRLHFLISIPSVVSTICRLKHVFVYKLEVQDWWKTSQTHMNDLIFLSYLGGPGLTYLGHVHVTTPLTNEHICHYSTFIHVWIIKQLVMSKTFISADLDLWPMILFYSWYIASI